MKYTGRKMEQRWTGCSEELCSSVRSQPILPRVTEGGRPGPVDISMPGVEVTLQVEAEGSQVQG